MKMRYKILTIIIVTTSLLWLANDVFSIIGTTPVMSILRRTSDNIPLVSVPGKIIFHSDRQEHGLYLLENGEVDKISGEAGQAVFSRDGKKVMHFYRGNLAIRDLRTKIIEKVIELPNKYSIVCFDWSPDDRKICFTADPIDDRKSFKNLFIYDIYTEEIKQLTFFEGDTPWSVTNPKWSPDGTKIAFECPKNIEKGDTGAPISIFLINDDGTDLHEIFGDEHWGGGYASWSSDGRKIVFISCADDENKETDIFIYDFEIKKLTRVTKDNWMKRNPVFSPDGKKICYVSPRHGNILFGAELFVVNIDGTGQARLTAPFKRKDPSPLRKWATDDYPQWSE